MSGRRRPLTDALWLLGKPEWVRGRPAGGRPEIGKRAGHGTEPIAILLLGVKINKWHRVDAWLPLLLSMPPMLRDLVDAADSGLLGYRLLVGPGPRQAMIVQYWSGPQALLDFAQRDDGIHRVSQGRYWPQYAGAGGAVGVWHEMLIVDANAHHSLYGNMPPTGIGAIYGTNQAAWKSMPERAPDHAPGPAAAHPER